MTLNDVVLTVIVPVVTGGLGVTAVSSWFAYRANKPKTAAEAQKIDAEVVVTFADGWKNYAAEMKEWASKLQDRIDANEHEIDSLKRAIREQDEKNRQTLSEKDEQIYELQTKNRTLELRVSDLEIELNKYRLAEQARLGLT